MTNLLVHILLCLLLPTLETGYGQVLLQIDNVSLSATDTDLQMIQPEEEQKVHEVHFNYKITANRKGHITCEVILSTEARQALVKSGPTSLSRVYLRCPQVDTKICYVDCTPACVFDDHNGCVVPQSLSTVIEECHYEQEVENGRLILEYIVDMEELDRTGDWTCEYQGVSAMRSLKLQASAKPKTTSTASIATITTSTSTQLPKPMSHIRQEPNRIIVSQSASLQQDEVEEGSPLRDSLRHGNHDSCLGRCLCLESPSDSSTTHSTKCYHQQMFQGHVPYGLMQSSDVFPSQTLRQQPPLPQAFFAAYPDQQSEFSVLPSYRHQISPDDCGVGDSSSKLAAQPHATLSTTSSSDTGTSNQFPVSLSGTLPTYYPGKSDSIEIASVAGDVSQGQQPRIYLIKMNESLLMQAGCTESNLQQQKLRQQQQQQSRHSSTVSTTVYDDLSGGIGGGVSNYHTVAPALVRLPAGEAGIILCHRPDTVVSNTHSEVDFASRKLPPPPERQQ
ncbi:unnamed protein product [Mesocestoides corti]|uniref:Ig-like domain-containing protein n=1 Tax=Mesocestoides corti TaxID=53468 RepID=A0A0R3ULV6_MESCO|nr:unnamed protein product [Mesocestoides corti]